MSSSVVLPPIWQGIEDDSSCLLFDPEIGFGSRKLAIIMSTEQIVYAEFADIVHNAARNMKVIGSCSIVSFCAPITSVGSKLASASSIMARSFSCLTNQ